MGSSKSVARAANWDLLRSLAMFLVVVVHTSTMLGPIHGFETAALINRLALICDPIFFMLSGYFALRPMKRSLKNYYLNKVSTVLLPLVLYALLLYGCSEYSQGLSLGGYFLYFANLLANGWWFIPALVPCLVVAPFLYKGLEALSDRQVMLVGAILAALFLSGGVFTSLRWLFASMGIETLANMAELALKIVPPSMLTSYPAYYQFFILGGIFYRLAPVIDRRMGNCLIAAGMAFWLIDVAWGVLGLPLQDPSYFWVFSAFGVMVLFARIDIGSALAQRAISWVAKRSYAVYLLQYTTIHLFSSVLYGMEPFGPVVLMAAPFRIAVWFSVTLGAYFLALAVASVFDPLVLSKLQQWFKKTFIKPEKPSESAKNL